MKRTVKSLQYLGSAFDEISKAFTAEKPVGSRTVHTSNADRRMSKLQIRTAVDEALLQGLNDGYYAQEFDAVAYELSQLPSEKGPGELELLAEEQTSILEVIGALLTRHVLKNYTRFVEGIDDIGKLQTDLQLTLQKIKGARQCIQSSSENTAQSLRICENTRKKQKAGELLDSLEKVKGIKDLDSSLREVVEDENFAQAFWLCAQSFAWTEDMPGLRLAEHLSAATGQGYRETSSLLRVALQAVCADFQPERYMKVAEGYMFLEKQYQLGEEVTAAFTLVVDSILLDSVKAAFASAPELEEQVKVCLSAQELMKMSPLQSFIPCLKQVLALLFDTVSSHYRMTILHQKMCQGMRVTLDALQERIAETREASKSVSTEKVEEDVGKDHVHSVARASSLVQPSSGRAAKTMKRPSYTKVSAQAFVSTPGLTISDALPSSRPPLPASQQQRLQDLQELECEAKEVVEWISLCASVDHSLVQSRRLLVEDGARKIKLLLSSPHAAHPDHFLQVLQWCHLFVTLGDSFSDSSDPGNLKDQLATLGYTYYRSSHKANMQSLFSALEKERWLPSTQQQVQSPGQDGLLSLSKVYELEKGAAGTSGFEYWAGMPNPWTNVVVQEAPSKTQETAQSKGSLAASALVSTASSRKLQDSIQKYASMLGIMEPAAVLVTGICELFDMYLLAVFRSFSDQPLASFIPGEGVQEPSGDVISERLKGTVTRVLTQSLQDFKPGFLASKPDAPRGSIFVRALGFEERLCALQSLLGLADHLRGLRKRMQEPLSRSQAAALDTYFARTVEASGDLADCILRVGAKHSLAISQMPEAIAEYRYDLADPPDSSSAWVEEICSHAIALKEQLGAAPDVDQNLRVKIWRHGLQHIAETCLEGLSRVRTCNAIGRAAMTSDVQDLSYSLKNLLAPLPRELAAQLETSLRLVDNYVKAFFLGPDQELQRWVMTHPEYSPQQKLLLAGLIADFRDFRRKQKSAFLAQAASWIDEQP